MNTIENVFPISGEVNQIAEQSETHIPSKVQADTLFTFTSEPEFLIEYIKLKMIAPRYCEEDVEYLSIPGIKKMAYPMKCFCDINLHKIDEHLSWYGYYGLAFSKEWGMKNGIQPIQYINPSSELRKDFSVAFSAALKIKVDTQSEEHKLMKSFLLHEIMYYKPYSGLMRSRTDKDKVEEKCFTDECEWRYIPDVTVKGYQQVFYDDQIFNAGVLAKMSNSMSGIPEISLKFSYADLKYIIIKNAEDFQKLTNAIQSWNLTREEEYELVSKIIVWEKSRGDF